jgi:polyhydroxyalkanoate synthesis regulator phasin
MPENPTPAAHSDQGETPGELNFTQPEAENPRIKRRTLKAKTGTAKPAVSQPVPEQEIVISPPPSATVKISSPAGLSNLSTPAASSTSPKSQPAASAPPRVTPLAAAADKTAAAKPVQPSIGVAAPKTGTKANSASNATLSPHGTRPATLYYSTYPSKDKETPAQTPMKTTSAASTSPASSSSTAASASAASPTSAMRTGVATPRASTQVDYRANVERQSREQKSVGSILTYVVIGMIIFLVLGVGLAGYGASVIFKQLRDQSVTVTDLDAKYAVDNQQLTAKLTATQQDLTSALAQQTRQQELIVKQQDQINRLLSSLDEVDSAIKQEKASRAQDTSALRARVRDLENKSAAGTTTQRY